MTIALIIVVLTILAVLVYVIGAFATLHQQEAQVFEERRTIDDIHDQTIHAMFDAARESGAFKQF